MPLSHDSADKCSSSHAAERSRFYQLKWSLLTEGEFIFGYLKAPLFRHVLIVLPVKGLLGKLLLLNFLFYFLFLFLNPHWFLISELFSVFCRTQTFSKICKTQGIMVLILLIRFNAGLALKSCPFSKLVAQIKLENPAYINFFPIEGC